MSSVYFDPAVGGDGSTVTDDSNATTGLANGGHRTRFVPAMGQVVAIAGNVVAKSAQAVVAAASAVNAPGTSATSTTSLAVGTGSKAFTIQTGKAFAVGQFVIAASAANVGNFMLGQITAHNSTTGALSVNVTVTGGSGTYADWSIAVSAPGAGDVTLTGTQTLANKTLTSPTVNGGAVNDATINGPMYSRDDDGTISGGTWAIDYANGPVIKATAGANITSITMANWPASGTAGHLRLMLIKSTFAITFPSWVWIKSDLTTTTTFADLGLTLPSAVPVLIDLFSDEGGTTTYAAIVRN